jgi:hypothetical protein
LKYKIYIKIKIKIIKNSKLNIKTIKYIEKGFIYIEDLGISYQGVDSNKCIHEIFNQCLNNNIKLELDIEFKNKEKINICI